MGGTVVVMERAEYEEWLGGGAALSPVEAGAALFQQMGCATCHAAGDQSRGPKLDGIYEKEVTLKGGETVVANDEYIRESIVEPAAKVVDGFAPLMPSFKNQLSDDDVANLVAYIKSLSE